MGLEFQDFYNLITALDPRGTDEIGSFPAAEEIGEVSKEYYHAQMLIYDDTLDIAKEIIHFYWSALYVGLDKYLKLAEEACNANDEGDFNHFFLDGMDEIYTDGLAPWTMATLVYHVHLDLIGNMYNGNIEEIKAHAEADAIRISPQGGNLLELRAFYNRMEALYTTYYAGSSAPDTDWGPPLDTDGAATRRIKRDRISVF